MSPENQSRRALYAYIDGYESLSVVVVNCAAMIGFPLKEHIEKEREKDPAFRQASIEFASDMAKVRPKPEEDYWHHLSEESWSRELPPDPRVLLRYVPGVYTPKKGDPVRLPRGIPGLRQFAEVGELRDKALKLPETLNSAHHGTLTTKDEQLALEAIQTLHNIAESLTDAELEERDLQRIEDALQNRADWISLSGERTPAPLRDETCVAVHWVEPTDTIPGTWSVVAFPPQGAVVVHHEQTTPQVLNFLKDECAPPLRIGLAFCFSCPEDDLEHSWTGDHQQLWAWCAEQRLTDVTAMETLRRQNTRFRILAYKDGNKMRDVENPADKSYFRKTELDTSKRLRAHPNSFFDIGGPGSVGALAVTGMPLLKQLKDKGASVWPFDSTGDSQMTCVEIFPPGLWASISPDEPPQSKRSRMRRREFLSAIQREKQDKKALNSFSKRDEQLFIDRERAFDALLTAWALRNYGDNLEELNPDPGSPELLEGKFWLPTLK